MYVFPTTLVCFASVFAQAKGPPPARCAAYAGLAQAAGAGVAAGRRGPRRHLRLWLLPRAARPRVV